MTFSALVIEVSAIWLQEYILMFMHTLDHVIHTSIACTTE